MSQALPDIQVPASKLSIAPSNVRKRTDPVADSELKASILARGIIQNLIGLPVARKKGEYQITAGGRRLTQLKALINEGKLPADYPVMVKLLSNRNDAAEISLVENFNRLNMLGHVSRLSFDRKNKRMVCLFQAARSAYPKSWRRAAWNKHLRGGCGIVPLAIGGDESVTRTPLGLSARLSAPHI